MKKAVRLRLALSTLLAAGVALVLFLPARAADTVSIKSIDRQCLETSLSDCVVRAAGFVTPDDAPPLAYQLQSGIDEYDGIAGAAVVYQQIDGAWQKLALGTDGVVYELPHLAQNDQVLFHIPGFTAGTGAFNADLLFEYGAPDAGGDGQWHSVDMDAWLETVAEFLPPEREIWKGVDYNFGDWYWGDYNARTSLWQPDDANCCATGGSAVIHFDIVDYALKVSSVDYTPPTETKE